MVHFSKGNRYQSKRDDGRYVPMEMLACQFVRVQLPKKDRSTFDLYSVTCSECLKVLLRELLEKATYCNYKLKSTMYVKPSGFRFPKRRRLGRVKFEIDDELLKRIEIGS